MAKILTGDLIDSLKDKVDPIPIVKTYPLSSAYTSSGSVTTIQYGRIVFLMVDDIRFTNYDDGATLATGLPLPVQSSFLLIGRTSSTNPATTRLIVSAAGELKFHYGSVITGFPYTGVITYIAK